MGKGKLEKFAALRTYPHVFELSYVDASTPPFPLKGKWNQDFFKNDHPITLELGCGKGEYTTDLAVQYPARNFIGIDIKGARIWKGATDSLQAKLPNVAFIRTHIELITHFFAPGEVSEIWITFPDPQMKKLGKRLTSTSFIQRYRQVICPGGIIHLKTDSNFLFSYTRLMLEASRITPEVCTTDLYATQPDEQLAIKTHYEKQWLERGIPIKYLRFRLNEHDVLKEPDVEIPFDDYRSYNRIRRSEREEGK